jgi:hypothetical protein
MYLNVRTNLGFTSHVVSTVYKIISNGTGIKSGMVADKNFSSILKHPPQEGQDHEYLGITGFLDFAHRAVFEKLENITFRKLSLFLFSGEVNNTYTVGSLRAND